MLQFEVVDESVWESLSSAAKRKPTKWDSILAQLEEGKIIRIPLDEKDKRSYRIGIGRTATSRGYKVEFRDAEGALVMRKSDRPILTKKGSPAAPAEGRKRGRPRKNPDTTSEGSGE